MEYKAEALRRMERLYYYLGKCINNHSYGDLFMPALFSLFTYLWGKDSVLLKK